MKRGTTRAVLNISGKIPSRIQILKRLTTCGKMTLHEDFKTLFVIQSYPHDFLLSRFRIRLETSFSLVYERKIDFSTSGTSAAASISLSGFF